MSIRQATLFHILFASWVTCGFAQQSSTDLDAVIGRASEYVSQYEADLGNLIGGEEYVQTSVWYDNSNPPRVAKRMQRRTTSDFLIIQVAEEWAALRKVNRVDGLKVKETAPAFDAAFGIQPRRRFAGNQFADVCPPRAAEERGRPFLIRAHGNSKNRRSPNVENPLS
jgi:hypothetical protein